MSDDSSKLGPTCHFEGENATARGRCIVSSCQGSVNACCGDSSCRNALSGLDRCAQTGGPDCAQLKSATYDKAPVAVQKLGDCIVGYCASSCETSRDGGVSGHANVHCSGSQDSCTCDYSPASSNEERCGELTVDHALCCQDIGWPGRGLSCGCHRWACKDTSSGCECNDYSDGPKTTCEKKASGHHCCATDYSTCVCSAEACFGSAVEVASCANTTARCSSNEEKVDRCN
ncbi:hypothetical protein LZC95_28290 [Pendulispora brunnea]|uniref:Uncharacterized protein n=1 Tax=Pendulispora brunnea TaxID=2905690 RepID=A0ABZ2K017_9BACT